MSRPNVAFALLAVGCAPVGPPPDPSVPQVVSVSPANGQTGVSARGAVKICASLPLQPSTLTDSTVVLTRADGHKTSPVVLGFSANEGGTCFSATPTSPLAPLSHYTLELRKGILSLAGVTLGGASKTVALSETFFTEGPAPTAALVLPPAGALAVPLDLASVVVDFSQPVQVPSGSPPFDAMGVGLSATALSRDGRRALGTVVPGGAVADGRVVLQLAPGLTDDTAQPALATGGPLTFAFGTCAEKSAPSLGAGTVLARDTDALLIFAVDRPGLCGAQLDDPGCPDAGAETAPANCAAPYDPCTGGALCTCSVALFGLCPGASDTAVGTLQGLDGQQGSAAPVAFSTSPPLPAVVLTEVLGGTKQSAFVEVQNRGGAPLDLLGLTLADCGLSPGCAAPSSSVSFGPFAGGPTAIGPGAYALLVDGEFQEADIPTGTLLLAPQGGVPSLALSTSKAQSLALFSPVLSAPLSSYDGSLSPTRGLSFERVNPGAPDPQSGNWEISTTPGGTPAACNSVTPGSLCDPD